ncbi:insulin gene enhancer protein ISL-2B isoform X4 [Daktulosphaira vitifoliae]|uniref:insulin gene enhancer protein ISL-2B isoform X4 n=1 Tax=Daktulosphaira vitifoliae TaxID=58002 RepID=UPI0021AAADD7|nr:insulin gene enhancer protein ISL-2B isoform X4 [Daktulosphaira vitifoliae]
MPPYHCTADDICTRSKFVADADCFMVERAPTVSSTTSNAWAPGHAWSPYCSPSAGTTTLATLMPSALHRGPLRISPVKSEPYDMSADIPSINILLIDISERRRLSLCVGCGGAINDQYILKVAPDLEWHAACLKCAECHQFLDEHCTCFVRDGKTYCKLDYVRLFGTKCDKCNLSFDRTDYVMRAKTKVYHMECFRCNVCSRQLNVGEEFALRDGTLLCKDDHSHHPIINGAKSKIAAQLQSNENNNNNTALADHNTSSTNSLHHNEGSNSDSSESGSNKCSGRTGSDGPGNSRLGSAGKGSSDGKPTRVRTVLNEKQLHTLRTCYSANPRPDALMKEQLVEMTGLSPRVIRVWFQNKRCKDKKRAIALKQQIQQDKMHGYDIHGPPPPMTRLDIDPGPVDMMHPDSTDSFVTYLESDDSLHNDTSSP